MMKNLFFFLLLFSFPAIAQNEDDELFLNYGTYSTLGKVIKMPKPNRGALYSFLNTRNKKSSKHIITSDSVYKKIFSGYSPDSLPVIDFTKLQLILSYYCAQCITSCGPINYPCHRNACMFRYFWHVRNKKSA